MNKMPLTFEFTPEAVQRLDEMCLALGEKPRANTIRMGLQILDHMLHVAQEHGRGQFLFRTADGEWEIEVPLRDAFWKDDQSR